MNEASKEISESDLINLLNDIHFDRIELGLRKVNFFDILQISKAEIRHSNFLGWLFDPNEAHGLKELVLKRTLRDIFSDERAVGLNALDADSIDYRNVEIKREWQNIDLLILIDGKIICIENKVDSKEHSNQLNRYKKIVQDNFPKRQIVFVFLTPQGDLPQDVNIGYIPYSYVRFNENLEKLMEIYGNTLNQKIQNYINDYISVLKRNIMKNDYLNELAIKLYKSHKTTLNFIFENMPDLEQEIHELFEQKVIESGWVLGSRNKGYVRFLTPSLNNIIPRYDSNNGWPLREAFLFEIDFFWTSKNALNIKTIISPGEDTKRDILKDVLSKVEGAQKPYGEKWISHFILKKKFEFEKMNELDEMERMTKINSIWSDVEELVNKVETAILNDGRMSK
ncbi:MAG: PD-(D/E)XK nuclease family protein [bacterium]|nr:PD-(D/E)XK nuclease family protein [bacterium]